MIDNYATPPTNDKNKKTILFVGLGIVFVLLIATVTVFILSSQKVGNNNVTQKEPITLASIGDALKARISDNDRVSVATATSAGASLPLYNVVGAAWVEADAGATVLTVTVTSPKENELDAIVSELQLKELSPIVVADSPVRYFASEDNACSVSSHVSSVQVDCADKSSFAKNTDTFNHLMTLYSATDSAQPAVFVSATTNSSATEGYATSRVAMRTLGATEQSLVGEFYQTPDKQWHFFATTDQQDTISCDRYNSDELTAAYKGFGCIGQNSSNSFVQPDIPAFEIEPNAIGG